MTRKPRKVVRISNSKGVALVLQQNLATWCDGCKFYSYASCYQCLKSLIGRNTLVKKPPHFERRDGHES